MFITFEGTDGSGKTTTLKYLAKYLKDLKVNFILTREPGGANSRESEKIREIILSQKTKITDMTEVLLYAADRRLNLEQTIWPALKKNQVVLCDRYVDSTFAYQGFGRQLGFEKMKVLQDLITENTYPDLTIFFDLSLEESNKRINQRLSKDRLEKTDWEFKKRVYEGYKKLVQIFPQRFVVINASKSKEEVLNKVKDIIFKTLNLKS